MTEQLAQRLLHLGSPVLVELSQCLITAPNKQDQGSATSSKSSQ